MDGDRAVKALTLAALLAACSNPPAALEYTEDPPPELTDQERLQRALDSLEREGKRCEPWPQCQDPRPDFEPPP